MSLNAGTSFALERSFTLPCKVSAPPLPALSIRPSRVSGSGGLIALRSPGCGVLERRRFKCAAFEETDNRDPVISQEEERLGASSVKNRDSLLVSGSPIVIVEAPALLKTAEPMPMMRPNRGLIKPGDAGRVIDRRPKDMWAVRFAVGAYLIDRKCFKPLETE